MCTAIRFLDSDGNLFFGRNLDWSVPYGERVVVTPPGASVPPAFVREDIGSDGALRPVIGTALLVEGLPLYFDCANDAGLAVAGLNFPLSASYAERSEPGRTNVAAYEFPLWVARHFSTVEQVRSALGDVTVVARPPAPGLPAASLHWMVADAMGSIVVECLERGMVVWENDADVLTNEPEFGWHRTNLRNYLTLMADEPGGSSWGSARLEPFGSGMGTQGMPGDYSGPARFVRAAFVNARYPRKASEDDNVIRLFRTLGSVAVPEGAAVAEDGSREKTLYTAGYSAATRTYYRSTYDDPRIRAHRLDDCPEGAAEPLAL